jgi:diacylglycerol kinase (ATP)
VPNNSEPLLCFVNSKSGGNQGLYICTELKKLLHPAQIIDVSKVNPKKALDEFSKLPAYKVLVCGGDGTVGWILNCLSDLSSDTTGYGT